MLKGETIAVLGYGVQGPGQALNLRDNGFPVIVGQREGGETWDKALRDGFVPGRTLFPVEEAARRGSVIQYLLSDAGQVATWPAIKKCLNPGDALYFSHGFGITYKEQTGIVPPDNVDVILVAPKGSGRTLRTNFLDGSGSIPVLRSTRTTPGGPGSGRWRWGSPSVRVSVSHDLLQGGFERSYRGTRGVDGCLAGVMEASTTFCAKTGTRRARPQRDGGGVDPESDFAGGRAGDGLDVRQLQRHGPSAGALDWAPQFRDAVVPVSTGSTNG